MFKYFFILCSLFLSVQTLAQSRYSTDNKKALKNFDRAMSLYQQRNNVGAKTELERALEEDNNFAEAHMLLGTIYEDEKNYTKAIESYHSAVEAAPQQYSRVYFTMARLEMNIEKYDEALKDLNTFLSLSQTPKSLQDEAKKLRPNLEFAVEARKHPVPFQPRNLGAAINSADLEYCPALTADEETFYYTRLIMKERQEDVFISKKKDGQWLPAQNLGAPINTDSNEGAICISPDGKYMFFTACGRPGGMGDCDIYMAEKEGGRWGAPINLRAPVNTNSFESQPSFSSDGRTLYFVSSRPGGLGNTDIWSSQMQDTGTWSQPVNLGDKVNTPSTEFSPFIHPDDQTLYFTSDGHPGMGSQDFFYSRKDAQGKWQSPSNLGYPINTGSEERSLTVSASGKLAYYSSAKENDGEGKLDLYEFELYKEAKPKPVSYVKGRVFDNNSKNPISSTFELIDLKTSEVIVSEKSDKVNGEFLVCLPAGRNYALNVSKPGYLFYSETFSLKNASDVDKPLNMDIPLSPIKEGQSVTLRNLFFDVDSYSLKDESKAELQKLEQFLKANPKLKIEVAGHTDNTGDKSKNIILSQNRAKAVYDYLLSNGIPADRLSYKGFGDAQPLASNTTEEGKAKNRRTTFMVTFIGK